MRAAFRLARVGLHLLWGAATVAVVYPWLGDGPRRALKRRWSHQLLETLGVKLGAGGAAHAPLPAGLVVANHVSWLDIFVINALAPTGFVAKDDVAHWPLIGWLCANTETIFLERGSRASAQRTRETMVAALRAGRHVGVFPEGTTSGGERVLPFHGALFQSAVDAGAPVVPLALRYVDRAGRPSRAPAYDGEVSLWESLCAIVRADGLVADLRVLEPVQCSTAERRALAGAAQRAIVQQLESMRSAGNLAEKVLPLPGTDWIRSVPPWRASTCLTMASPSPVPPAAAERPLSTR